MSDDTSGPFIVSRSTEGRATLDALRAGGMGEVVLRVEWEKNPGDLQRIADLLNADEGWKHDGPHPFAFTRAQPPDSAPDIFEGTYEPAAAPHREDGEGDAEGTLRTMVGKLWEWHRANYKLAFPLTPKEWGDLERILDSAVPVLCAQPPASDTDREEGTE